MGVEIQDEYPLGAPIEGVSCRHDETVERAEARSPACPSVVKA
jgi:hypothetical protein